MGIEIEGNYLHKLDLRLEENCPLPPKKYIFEPHHDFIHRNDLIKLHESFVLYRV